MISIDNGFVWILQNSLSSLDVHDIMYKSVLQQRHVRLLGRAIDLSDLISQVSIRIFAYFFLLWSLHIGLYICTSHLPLYFLIWMVVSMFNQSIIKSSCSIYQVYSDFVSHFKPEMCFSHLVTPFTKLCLWKRFRLRTLIYFQRKKNYFKSAHHHIHRVLMHWWNAP